MYMLHEGSGSACRTACSGVGDAAAAAAVLWLLRRTVNNTAVMGTSGNGYGSRQGCYQWRTLLATLLLPEVALKKVFLLWFFSYAL